MTAGTTDGGEVHALHLENVLTAAAAGVIETNAIELERSGSTVRYDVHLTFREAIESFVRHAAQRVNRNPGIVTRFVREQAEFIAADGIGICRRVRKLNAVVVQPDDPDMLAIDEAGAGNVQRNGGAGARAGNRVIDKFLPGGPAVIFQVDFVIVDRVKTVSVEFRIDERTGEEFRRFDAIGYPVAILEGIGCMDGVVGGVDHRVIGKPVRGNVDDAVAVVRILQFDIVVIHHEHPVLFARGEAAHRRVVVIEVVHQIPGDEVVGTVKANLVGACKDLHIAERFAEIDRVGIPRDDPVGPPVRQATHAGGGSDDRTILNLWRQREADEVG